MSTLKMSSIAKRKGGIEMANPGGGRKARRRMHMAESVNKAVGEFDAIILLATWEYTYPPTKAEYGTFLGWACRKGFLECIGTSSDGLKLYIRLAEVVLE
jgi:hypothetical protein